MRRLLAFLLALAGLFVATPVHAAAQADPQGLETDAKLVLRLHADESSMLVNKRSNEVAYRVAARDEQLVIYSLAADSDLENAVLPQLPAAQAAAFEDSIQALRALYRLAGVDQSRIRPRFTRGVETPSSLDDLSTFYRQSGDRYAMDWTYLASINFIESDFGRVMGPSSAGALGPMQFMPSTWDSYGNGGDVMSPHDAIDAAARYLIHYGAPGDMPAAIWHYNHDDDYVAAVSLFASMIRRDPAWLDRLYYWSTQG